MAETEVDIDGMLEDVPLEGEEAEKPQPAKTDVPGEKGDAKEDAKPEAPDKKAEDIDKRIKKIFKDHLANPDAACLMVDIMCPGEAIVAIKGDFELSPKMHLLLAAVVIFGVALASNPEVMAKLRSGFARSRKKKEDAALPERTEARKQFAGNGAQAAMRAAVDQVPLDDEEEVEA